MGLLMNAMIKVVLGLTSIITLQISQDLSAFASNYRFCHACFVGNYNVYGARNKADREETLKKQEELEKAYELKIRKQITDGELQIP